MVLSDLTGGGGAIRAHRGWGRGAIRPHRGGGRGYYQTSQGLSVPPSLIALQPLAAHQR